jgi:hypothetical protein
MLKLLLLWLAFLAMVAWAGMAAFFSTPPLRERLLVIALFVLAQALSAWLPAELSRKALCSAGVFLFFLAWWTGIRPSNDRDWNPDVAVLPYVETAGGNVKLRNIRNNSYRAEFDYTPRYYDKTFGLDDLRSLDLFLGYWGPKHIAHTMLSFGLADGSYFCVSIETRKTRGQKFSSIRGLFKQYELIYVLGDERDLVRLRTAYRRDEHMYLFRLEADRPMIRTIFLEYAAAMNELRARPRWYNAFTANCTTSIWKHVVPHYPKLKMDWRLIFSGYSDRMVYDLGLVDTALPFEELKRKSYVNPASNAAGDSPAYSALIRKGLPGFGD